MKNSITKIDNQVVKRMVVETLERELGIRQSIGAGWIDDPSHCWIGVCNDTICLSQENSSNYKNSEKVSLEELLLRAANADEVIYIEDDVVQFKEGYIKVGCTEIPNETVKEIYKRIIKLIG